MSSTTFNNLGVILADWINNSGLSFSASIVDTNNVVHKPSFIVAWQTQKDSITIWFVDTSNDSYTASYVQMTINNYTVYTIPVSATKNANEPLFIELDISVSSSVNLNMFIIALLQMFAGIKPIISFSASTTVTVIQYQSNSSSSSCESTVASQSSEGASSVTYSGNGNSLTVKATFGAGSCQQLQNPQITFSDNVNDTLTVYMCPSTPCSTSVCGYNQSCSHSASVTITAS